MSDGPAPKSLPRRNLLIGAGAAAAAASCGPGDGKAPAVHGAGGKKRRWKLVSSFPSSLDAMFGSAEVFCREVETASHGRFKIRPHQAGELVPGGQVLDAVQKGAVQVGQTASYYYTGKASVLAFETCVPFGLTARQQSAWLDEGGGRELLAPVFADFGVVSLPGGNTGAQMGGWFRERIDSLGDLRGLKMRIPGLGSKVMGQLGVTVKSLAGGEIYQALERGAIDATEWVGPHDDLKLGFHEVARNYYYPGWWEPGPHLAYFINRDAYLDLPEGDRVLLRLAARRAAQVMQTRYDALNPRALAELVAKGVTVRPFSDDLMAGAREAAEQLLADEAAKDATYAKVLGEWRKFREASFAWFGAAEFAYARFAFGER